MTLFRVRIPFKSTVRWTAAAIKIFSELRCRIQIVRREWSVCRNSREILRRLLLSVRRVSGNRRQVRRPWPASTLIFFQPIRSFSATRGFFFVPVVNSNNFQLPSFADIASAFFFIPKWKKGCDSVSHPKNLYHCKKYRIGAGNGNRTHLSSLGSSRSTDELCPLKGNA